MNIKENIRIAIFSIRTNLMRSLLTMLGIIIGVAAVIAIITLGTGGRDYIVGMIRDMGQSMITIGVNTSNASENDYITTEDVNLIRQLDGIKYVSPFIMNIGSASTERATGATAMVLAGTSDLQYLIDLPLEYGTYITQEEFDSAQQVCLLDTGSAKTMFGYDSPVGETLQVTVNDQRLNLRIVGVVDMQSMSGGVDNTAMLEMMGGGSMVESCLALIPSTLSDIVTGNSGRYDTLYLTATDELQLDAAGNAALELLYNRHQNYDVDKKVYNLVNMATFIDLLDTVINVFTTFIAAVSAISLLVGGIGVMNIMLVSVTERTREIGIRKALGAKTGTILFQFLTESVILCAIGGVLGLILGVSGAYLVGAYIGVPIALQFSTVVIAVGFSSAIGIFFGIYPARRAAKMHPIEALRRE